MSVHCSWNRRHVLNVCCHFCSLSLNISLISSCQIVWTWEVQRKILIFLKTHSLLTASGTSSFVTVQKCIFFFFFNQTLHVFFTNLLITFNAYAYLFFPGVKIYNNLNKDQYFEYMQIIQWVFSSGSANKYLQYNIKLGIKYEINCTTIILYIIKEMYRTKAYCSHCLKILQFSVFIFIHSNSELKKYKKNISELDSWFEYSRCFRKVTSYEVERISALYIRSQC